MWNQNHDIVQLCLYFLASYLIVKPFAGLIPHQKGSVLKSEDIYFTYLIINFERLLTLFGKIENITKQIFPTTNMKGKLLFRYSVIFVSAHPNCLETQNVNVSVYSLIFKGNIQTILLTNKFRAKK